MTLEIAFVLGLLPLVLLCLTREWFPPELTAMAAFALLMGTGVLDIPQALSVFSHPAPVTIGSLLVISACLEKTGGLEALSSALRRHLPASLHGLLLGTTVVVALASAFINNTPIVALFMPLLLGLAQVRKLAPSKLLIPLSYASILGGCCTLVGTSTNLIVSGIMNDYGYPALGMFELGRLGIPLAVLGLLYIAFVLPRLLPARGNVTATLSEDDRKSYFCQLMVTPDSRWVGRLLVDTVAAHPSSGFRLIEIRRKGATLTLPMNEIIIEPFDRVLISASPRLLTTQGSETVLNPEWTAERGLKALSTLQGGIMEGIVPQHSSLIGRSLEESRFRQRFGMLVLALHRQGHNLRKHFAHVRLQFGDTLLLLGPQWRFDELRERGELMLLDETPETTKPSAGRGAILSWISMAGVVLLTAFHILPIVAAALLGAVFLLLTRVISTEEATRAIDTSILFLIFGMLGLGLAMESSGAARWLANSLLQGGKGLFPEIWLPHLTLVLIILLTGVLTEMLSNTATAAVMAPVAYNLAMGIGADPRPFFIAVMLAASLSFTTPIGYQTNTMVFNAGGYRFGDFVRAGLPLSLGSWTFIAIGIPLVWPF